MIKFNRIGYKLGAVGLFGLLLAGGMLANQMMSESAIDAANERAGVQRTISDHTVKANIALRGMELAVRDVRQSRNQGELEKSVAALNAAFAAVTSEVDGAIGIVANANDRERLQKIRPLPSNTAITQPKSESSSSRSSRSRRRGMNIPRPGPRPLRICCCRRR